MTAHAQYPYHVFALVLVDDGEWYKRWEMRCKECGAPIPATPAAPGQEGHDA